MPGYGDSPGNNTIITYNLLTEFAFRTVRYKNQGPEVRADLATNQTNVLVLGTLTNPVTAFLIPFFIFIKYCVWFSIKNLRVYTQIQRRSSRPWLHEDWKRWDNEC